MTGVFIHHCYLCLYTLTANSNLVIVLLLIYVDSLLFTTISALLQHVFHVNTSFSLCRTSIFICLVFIAGSKVTRFHIIGQDETNMSRLYVLTRWVLYSDLANNSGGDTFLDGKSSKSQCSCIKISYSRH